MAKSSGVVGSLTVRVRASTEELDKGLSKAERKVNAFAKSISKLKKVAFGTTVAGIAALTAKYVGLYKEILKTDEAQKKMFDDMSANARQFMKDWNHYAKEWLKSGTEVAHKVATAAGVVTPERKRRSLAEQQEIDMAEGRITPRQFREIARERRRESMNRIGLRYSTTGGAIAGAASNVFGNNIMQGASGIRNRLAAGGLSGALTGMLEGTQTQRTAFERQEFQAPMQMFSGAASGTRARDQVLQQRRAMEEVERMRVRHEEEQDKKEAAHNKEMKKLATQQAENITAVENAIKEGFGKLQTTGIW